MDLKDKPEEEIHKREVAEFGISDSAEGRTLVARIVPYNTPTLVADGPGQEPYMEMFVPGAFQAQTRAPFRVDVATDVAQAPVFLNYGHDPSLRGIIGRGLALYDKDDALWGDFLVHDDEDGNKALRFVRDGLLKRMSLEFVSLRSRVVNGVVQRLKVKMPAVALVRAGAYPAAQVMAVREANVTLPRAEPLDAELVEKLKAKGFRIPGETTD